MKSRKFAIFGILTMLFIAAMIFATDVKAGSVFSMAVVGMAAMPNLKEDFAGVFATKSLKECRDLYVDRHKAAMGIINAAKAENRNLTPEEISNYNALNKQLEQLNIEIEQATKLEEQRKAEAGVYIKSQRTETPETKTEYRYADGTPVRTYDRNRAPQKEAGVFSDIGSFLRGVVNPKNLNPDEKRTLDSLTGSGAYSVPTNLEKEIIDMLRQDLALVNAGAVILNLKPGTTKICKITGDVTAEWKQQNVDANLSDPTVEDITLVPKTVVALTKLSAELFTDSINIAETIKKSMTAAIRKAVEDAAFSGLGGTSYGPTGIDETTGILKYWLGTAGAALSSFAPLNAVDYQLRSRGVKPSGIITSPAGHAAIMGLVDSTSGQPLQPPKNIANMPIFTSPSISEALTRGTSTTSTTSLYMGNWSDLLIAILEDIQIIIDPSVYRVSNSIAFLAKMRVDFALQHPASIARLSGILPNLTTLQTS